MKVELDNKLKTSPFIRTMSAGNYVICPYELMVGYRELTNVNKFLYIHLVRFGLMSIINNYIDRNGDPVVFPSQETLSELLNVSQPTISRMLKNLEHEKLISIRHRGQGSQNLITVHPVGLESVKELVVDNGVMHKFETPSKKAVGYVDSSIKDILSGNTGKNHREKHSKLLELKVQVIKHDKRSSVTLLDYFIQEYVTKFTREPSITRGKDLKLLKTMIEQYGYDDCIGIIDFSINEFSMLKSDKHITGNITVGIMYGFREYLKEKSEIYCSDDSEDGGSDW